MFPPPCAHHLQVATVARPFFFFFFFQVKRFWATRVGRPSTESGQWELWWSASLPSSPHSHHHTRCSNYQVRSTATSNARPADSSSPSSCASHSDPSTAPVLLRSASADTPHPQTRDSRSHPPGYQSGLLLGTIPYPVRSPSPLTLPGSASLNP